jgi:non-homologous end joining protein Ku
MDKINFSPENVEKLFQQAVDEAIEHHRIKGESIAISENGKVKIIPPEEITPLADKLKRRC